MQRLSKNLVEQNGWLKIFDIVYKYSGFFRGKNITSSNYGKRKCLIWIP